MQETAEKRRALTDEQRRLVEENIGLVRLHLRRNVRNLARPRRDREWPDLFQEGCLGLIAAAERYNPDGGIPFASFALARIHLAVSRALTRKFATIYVPPRRTSPRSRKDSGRCRPRTARESEDPGDAPGASCRVPKILPLAGELAKRLRARPQATIEDGDVETIGQRLRSKYERAVRTACDDVGRSSPGRGDRAELLGILVAERFLIPSEESRRPLRRIAGDTKSSYARVAQCGQRLGEAIRAALDADPEFHELRRRARADPDGPAAAIDRGMERRLVEAGATELVRRYRHAECGPGARLLHSVMTASRADIESTIRDRFAACPTFMRQKLLEETLDLSESKVRADPNERRNEDGDRCGEASWGRCRERMPDPRHS